MSYVRIFTLCKIFLKIVLLNTLKSKISPNFLSRIICIWSHFSEEGNLLNKFRRNSNTRIWLDLTEKLIAWYFFSSPPPTPFWKKNIMCIVFFLYLLEYVYCWCVFMWVLGKGDTSCETSHAIGGNLGFYHPWVSGTEEC